MSLRDWLWKKTAAWHHPEAEELVVIRRHRLTGSIIQTWHDDTVQLSGDEMLPDRND